VGAVARGIADWLRARPESKIIIESKNGTQSLKVQVEKIDPEVALRITEMTVNR
jgi:hypothetical protein